MMRRNDDNNEGAKDSSTGEELMSRSESSASSFSRSRSPVQLDVGISSGASQEDSQTSQTPQGHSTVNPNKINISPVQTGIHELAASLDGLSRGDVGEREHKGTPLQDHQMLENLGASHEIKEDRLSSTTRHQQSEMLFVADELPSSRPSSESSSSTQVAGELKNKEGLFQDYTEEQEQLRRQRMAVTRAENTSVEVVSISTQTEWSWMKDVELYQDVLNVRKPEWADRREKKLSKEGLGSPTANSHGVVKRHRRSTGRRMSVNSDREQTIDEDVVLPESDEGNEATKTDGNEEGSTGSRDRRKSKRSSVPKSHRSVVSPLPHTPKGGDILFRPPTVEPESSSSSSEENDYSDLQVEYMLPSIGPPTILQYMKESQNPPLSNVEVQDREEAAKDDMLRKSVFSAPCMFCQEEILPFPSVEELELFPPDQLFCCPQYERLVKFELAQRSDRFHLVDERIDVKPHPPYGTKAARRAAKERAAERAREREIERQRVAGGNPTNFYALTRQMKTITYSLASTKCMEEGWTVRPESASVADSEVYQDPFVIEVNPLQLRRQNFLERFYDNKRRFLVVLPDGTGCCYYPSGKIAVLITSTEKGKFTYIAYDDEEDNIETNNSRMLAIFQPSGHGTCYYRNGRVRLVLNPLSGVLLDGRGNRRKRWLWHNLKDHVHAPPFQPITFMMTRHLSIRSLSQTKTVLTFNHGKHTARFNVGVKIKAVPKARPRTSRDSYETHLAEVKQFVSILVDRVQTAMRLPNYPRLDKIPLPLHLQRARDAGKRSRLQTASPSDQHETTITVN